MMGCHMAESNPHLRHVGNARGLQLHRYVRYKFAFLWHLGVPPHVNGIICILVISLEGPSH